MKKQKKELPPLSKEAETENDSNLQVLSALNFQATIYCKCLINDVPFQGKAKTKFTNYYNSTIAFNEFMKEIFGSELSKEWEQQSIIFGEFVRIIKKNQNKADMIKHELVRILDLDIS